MTHNTATLTPIASVNSDEYIIALGEQPNATMEDIAAACEACDRLEARHKEAMDAEARLQRERIAAEAIKIAAAGKAKEAIATLEKDLKRRKQEAFDAKIGSAATAALARIGACLANGNDGGVVAAYYDFKKKSKCVTAQIPAFMRAGVKEAFARYDKRK